MPLVPIGLLGSRDLHALHGHEPIAEVVDLQGRVLDLEPFPQGLFEIPPKRMAVLPIAAQDMGR